MISSIKPLKLRKLPIFRYFSSIDTPELEDLNKLPVQGTIEATKSEPPASEDTPPPRSPLKSLVYSKLPPFARLKLKNIKAITTKQELEESLHILYQQRHLGFDTESIPNFLRGNKSKVGPHLMQFATDTDAYLFSTVSSTSDTTTSSTIDIRIETLLDQCDTPTHFYFPAHKPSPPSLPPPPPIQREPVPHDLLIKEMKALIEHPTIIKTGFDLTNDHLYLMKSFNIKMKSIVDLSRVLAPQQREILGATRASAYFFQQYFEKQKSISMSNWGLPIEKLTERQLLYAGNDAYIALKVYLAWKEDKRLPWSDETLLAYVEKEFGYTVELLLAEEDQVKKDKELQRQRIHNHHHNHHNSSNNTNTNNNNKISNSNSTKPIRPTKIRSSKYASSYTSSSSSSASSSGLSSSREGGMIIDVDKE